VRNTSKKPRPQADWVAIPMKPIIDRETFDAARAEMAINTERSARNNCRNPYLLRFLVVFGLCGCHITGISHTPYTYYRCTSKRTGSKKAIPHDDTVSVRHSKPDDLVWNALVDLLDDPARLEEHIARLDAEEARILDAYRENVIDLSQLKSQMEKLSAKRAHLNALRETLGRPTEPLQRPQVTRDMLGKT